MKLRVRAGKKSGRLELQEDEVTLGDLRRKLRQTFLPSLGFSPDVTFSITLNGSDSLTEDESSLESLGIISGDLIVVVTAAIPHPAPAQDQPPSATSQTSGTDYKSQQYQREAHDVAEPRPSSSQGAAGQEETMEEDLPSCPPGPMLCSEASDGKIPHSLEALYLSSSCTSANDALVVVTHLLMVETGYTEQGVKNKAAAMPEGWKSSSGVYKLHYSHPLCGNSSAALVCVPMGKLVIINATLTIGSELKCVKRLQLPTESYITYPPQDGNVAMVYRDLQKLSRLFKDQLVYPLLAATRQALELPDVFGLVVLPPELKLRIFRLLNARSILSLGATCKNLQADAEDPSLWRFLYMRDFRDQSVRGPHTDWKELYKQKYKQMFRVRRCGPHILDYPPFHPGPYSPDQYPPNFPYPPGIIGGEYDQRPTFPFARDPLSLLDPHRPRAPGLFRPARPRFDPLLPGLFQNPSQSRWGPFL
ncbi:F-box only protein 7 [Bufo gargarizans]|uniref:F-box only protein 7 n=1 Tax=Bufo gargarizans TaxID=30331 RepID=UPI001CF30BB6|nr:F-box only protein 7 [Bufo gargarizans]XP_044137140.1 F-box only protein 7 [Bufo gargarizans]XP_044137142.1 F-box only protein 7 [Bufo gargarizans]